MFKKIYEFSMGLILIAGSLGLAYVSYVKGWLNGSPVMKWGILGVCVVLLGYGIYSIAQKRKQTKATVEVINPLTGKPTTLQEERAQTGVMRNELKQVKLGNSITNEMWHDIAKGAGIPRPPFSTITKHGGFAKNAVLQAQSRGLVQMLVA